MFTDKDNGYIISRVFCCGKIIHRHRKCLFLIFVSMLFSACSSQDEHSAQGYIEGKFTYVAMPVAGRVNQFWVDKGVLVKKGQSLFQLEAQPERDTYQADFALLEQAKAMRNTIFANLIFAKKTYERYQILVNKKVLQQAELDKVKADYDALGAKLIEADASIASAKAILNQSRWRVTQKIGVAPTEAVVFDKYYQQGEYVVAGNPVLSLLAPGDIKLVFYVDEAILGGLHLQDPVKIRCDGCKHVYFGQIDFISPSVEYTPPIIFSTENSAKLMYRIEAAFTRQDAMQLHPGQPVTVTFMLAKGAR